MGRNPSIFLFVSQRLLPLQAHLHDREAIAKKMGADEKEENTDGLRLEDFIKNVSAEKLREFTITQAKYNTELNNAILLEFSTNAGNTKGNKY